MKAFLEIAQAVAKISKCKRKKVGAILVRNGVVIASGCNYIQKECATCYRENAKPGHWSGQDQCPAVHAEITAIINAARIGIPIEGTTMYCTYVPCIPCAKAIVQAKIKHIVFLDKYAGCEGALKVLNRGGVKITHYGNDAFTEAQKHALKQSN